MSYNDRSSRYEAQIIITQTGIKCLTMTTFICTSGHHGPILHNIFTEIKVCMFSKVKKISAKSLGSLNDMLGRFKCL